MNLEERRLIEGLFSRMRDMQGIDKDREAADLISREAEANPDAVYLLTQSVLVQEHALQMANARIEELEAAASRADQGSADRSSGFLPRGPAAATSTPQVGRAASLRSGAAGGAPAPATRNQDGERPRAGAGRPGGGSFMGQAMSTAAGVAGGMLLASGISSLFSDGGASAGEAGSAGDAAVATGGEPGAEAPVDGQTAGAEQAASDPGADAGQQEAGLQEAGMDGGDEGWFDFGDWGDFEL